MARARLHLECVTSYEDGRKSFAFDIVEDAAIPEAQRFGVNYGSVDMTATNPAVMEQFVIGQDYYIDFSSVMK